MYATDGTPVARYHLENAWPSKLEIGQLTSGRHLVGDARPSRSSATASSASRSELPRGRAPVRRPPARASTSFRVSAIAVLLALASSATWGLADFCGGLLSRRLPTIPVTVISQAAGFAALLVALAVAGGEVDGRSLWLGMLAGVGGGIGLAAFYKALSLGTMSIVSPVVACGAVVPFAISIATGERPSGTRGRRRGRRAHRRGARLDRGAARDRGRTARGPSRSPCSPRVALGLFTYFLGLGSREGSALSTLVGARIGSLAILLAARRRHAVDACASGGAGCCPIAAVGLCDVAANALFALASGRGLLVARLRARLAVPGDDGAARLRDPPRAADARADRRHLDRARGSRRAERRLSDGEPDSVRCGSEYDVAIVDPADRVDARLRGRPEDGARPATSRPARPDGVSPAGRGTT